MFQDRLSPKACRRCVCHYRDDRDLAGVFRDCDCRQSRHHRRFHRLVEVCDQISSHVGFFLLLGGDLVVRFRLVSQSTH